MKNFPDLDAVIYHLTGPLNFRVNELIQALAVHRSIYYSWRRSTNRFRRIELAVRLMELYPEHFPDGQIPSQSSSREEPGGMVALLAERSQAQASERKYIELLEKTVEDLRSERDRLRQEVDVLLQEVREGVGQLRQKLKS